MDGVNRPMNYPKVVLFITLSRAKRTGCTLPQGNAPTKRECFSLEGPMGLEPMTPCLKGRCSNQLSYGPGPYALYTNRGALSISAFYASSLQGGLVL